MLDRTHRFRRAGTTAAIAIAVVTLASCGDSTGPNNHQSALRPAGKYSRQILHLTEPFFWIAVIVGLVSVVVPTIAMLPSKGLRARKMHLALGPFLALGGMVALLAGDEIADWYTNG